MATPTYGGYSGKNQNIWCHDLLLRLTKEMSMSEPGSESLVTRNQSQNRRWIPMRLYTVAIMKQILVLWSQEHLG